MRVFLHAHAHTRRDAHDTCAGKSKLRTQMEDENDEPEAIKAAEKAVADNIKKIDALLKVIASTLPYIADADRLLRMPPTLTLVLL